MTATLESSDVRSFFKPLKEGSAILFVRYRRRRSATVVGKYGIYEGLADTDNFLLKVDGGETAGIPLDSVVEVRSFSLTAITDLLNRQAEAWENLHASVPYLQA